MVLLFYTISEVYTIFGMASRDRILELYNKAKKRFDDFVLLFPSVFYRRSNKTLFSQYTYDQVNKELNAPASYPDSLLNDFVHLIEIKKEDISAEDKETAIEMLTEIKEKINAQKKPSIIKSALVGLKDFLIGVGASATVAIIQAKMQGLF